MTLLPSSGTGWTVTSPTQPRGEAPAAAEIVAGIDRVTQHHGPWTTNYSLVPGVRTRDDEPDPNDRTRIRRLVQLVSDVAGRPVADLRILDLACLEGQVALEFARLGARVVGIEGRESNVAKARFAAQTLGLTNLELHHDDVRNLSRETYGGFDVVLCLGILYHLDDEDVFTFLQAVGEVCDGAAVVDTHVGLANERTYVFEGQTYAGASYVEHDADAEDDDKLANRWASLDNPLSLWLTRPSLYNFLSECGFTSVWECHQPRWEGMHDDRVTLLAVKGGRVTSLPSEPEVEIGASAWPELEPAVQSDPGLDTGATSEATVQALADTDERLQEARRKVRRLRTRVRTLRTRVHTLRARVRTLEGELEEIRGSKVGRAHSAAVRLRDRWSSRRR